MTTKRTSKIDHCNQMIFLTVIQKIFSRTLCVGIPCDTISCNDHSRKPLISSPGLLKRESAFSQHSCDSVSLAEPAAQRIFHAFIRGDLRSVKS